MLYCWLRKNSDARTESFGRTEGQIFSDGRKTFGRAKKFGRKNLGRKNFRQQNFDEKNFNGKNWRRLLIGQHQPKSKKASPAKILIAGKNLGRWRKSWSLAKILVVGENLGRRRKSWSLAKILVVFDDDDCSSSMTTNVRPRRQRLFVLDDDECCPRR